MMPDQRNALTSLASRAAQDGLEAERLMRYAGQTKVGTVSGIAELRALATDFERILRQMHGAANAALCRDEVEEVRG